MKLFSSWLVGRDDRFWVWVRWTLKIRKVNRHVKRLRHFGRKARLLGSNDVALYTMKSAEMGEAEAEKLRREMLKALAVRRANKSVLETR